MMEIKNHFDEPAIKNNIEKNTVNPEYKLDIQANREVRYQERYDPDKRIKNLMYDTNKHQDKIETFKNFVSDLNKKFDGMSIEEIITTPYEHFVEVRREISLDTLVLSTAYATSCKLACAEVADGFKNIDKAEVLERFENALKTYYNAPELINKYIQEYGVGPDKVKEAAGEVAEFVLELGKGIFYVRTRLELGVLQIVDNACRAAFSMGLFALGRSEDAKDIMTDSYLERYKDYLDKIVQPNELEKSIGDIADKAGELIGELALAVVGAMGITASAPIAAVGIISAAALLGLDEAGKNLENNIEKSGEYGKKEFISALVTVALTVTVERMLPCIGKITKEANIAKVANKVSNFTKGDMVLGAKLTKTILTSLQAGAGMAVFKGADEIKKIIDYELGITDSFDTKKELLETLGFIFGAATLGGGLSFVGDTIVRSKGFQELIKTIDKDVVFTESKYDVIYKRVELTKEYYQDILRYSTVPETIPKDIVDPEKIYKESIETIIQKREEFNPTKKAELIKEWENHYGREWPTYKEDVVITLKDGTKMLIRKAGDLYDAHHIVPLNWGGENVWQNLTPLHVDIHFDWRGVHAIDSAYSQLSKLMGGLL